MKIVHVLFRVLTGGTELMLIDIANRQALLGHDVTVVAINDGSDGNLLRKFSERVTVIELNRPESSKNPLWLYRINRLLWNISPDVVHCHDEKALGLIFKRSNTLYVFTVHCTGEIIRHSRKADLLCAISESVRDDVKARYGLDTVVVWNGCDFSAIEKKSAYRRPDDILKIVCVSRLRHEIKGQHLLIEAVSRMENKNVSLTFIGDGESMDYLRKLSSDLGMDDRVHFPGQHSRDFIYKNLRNYDLLVQPSLSEGFGLTIAEGLAAGLPVLISNLEGPMQIIDNGRFGTSFMTGNVKDLTDKLNYISDHYDDVAVVAAASYDSIRCRFDVGNTATNYIDIYTSTISRKKL